MKKLILTQSPASVMLTATAIVAAIVATCSSMSFVIAGGETPSPALAVSTAVGLVSAIAAALTSEQKGGGR